MTEQKPAAAGYWTDASYEPNTQSELLSPEALTQLRTQTLMTIHGQDVHRTYTVSDMKRMVYPLIAVVDELLQSKQNETKSKENFVSEPNEERVTQLPVKKTGDGCKCCYSTYERCTDLILRVTGRACCAQCSLTDTHNERDVT